MQLDIRVPIGLMFGLLGVILTVYGLMTGSDAAMYQKSLGININLWCGLVFAAFAALMLMLAWRAKGKG
jgi:protein-S-isoprenylcysteine O-methyltransferase Ste14